MTRPLRAVVGAADTHGAVFWIRRDCMESLVDEVASGKYGSEIVGIVDSELVGDNCFTGLYCISV